MKLLLYRDDDGAWQVAVPFTCPRCGRTSYNPVDAEQGYCGACHAWTGSFSETNFADPEMP